MIVIIPFLGEKNERIEKEEELFSLIMYGLFRLFVLILSAGLGHLFINSEIL